MSLILASASRRVAALLRDAGFAFEAVAPDVHTEIDAEETPDGYVRRVALASANSVCERAAGRPVIATATVVTLNGQVLDAPADAPAATRQLRMLAGRDHLVTTAVCLSFMEEGGRRQRTSVERTTVTLAAMSDAEIEWYVRTGEPIGAPGGYVFDGLASRFVTRVAGSPSNAAGLPVATVYQLCVGASVTLG